MGKVTVRLETEVRRSFRVEQMAGMFDLPLPQRDGLCYAGQNTGTLRHELTAEVPGLDEAWTIGAIVGPSGSGKTTLARAAFGKAMFKRRAWPRDRAIVDVLGEEVERGASTKDKGRSTNAECGVRNAEWEAEVGSTKDEGRTATIKVVARLLVGVGLGSPRTWLKPYGVLSGGERFRAELARALIQGAGARGQEPATEERVVVMDEFSGSLDRTVAKTASAAVARLLRGEGSGFGVQGSGEDGQARGLPHEEVPPGRRDLQGQVRFVAVTCHRDILPWLAPDWVVEVGGSECGVRSAECGVGQEESSHGGAEARSGEALTPALSQGERENSGRGSKLIWGRPGRPGFSFVVDRVPQAVWERFGEFHYLAGGLAASASCYAALWRKEAVGFCAVAGVLGHKGVKRIQRLVTLPEFQGMGIGGKLLDTVAAHEWRRGFRVTITASHPAVIAHCSRSERWRYMAVKKVGGTRQMIEGREVPTSAGRAVATFEFVPAG